MSKTREHSFFTTTGSPEVVGSVIAGLASLIFDPNGSVDVFVLETERPAYIPFPKDVTNSSAQDILWIIRIFEGRSDMNVDMWHKSFSGPAGDVGAITKFIVEELYRKGDGWRQRFVDWASKSPWCDWSLPTIDRTKLVLRHGSVPGERFAIGIIRA